MNMQTSNVMAPPAPKTLAQMKLPLAMMRDILLKTMFRRNETLVTELAKTICLPVPVVQELVDLARSQLLLEATGTMSAGSGNEMGLDIYREQIKRQSIRNIQVTRDQLTTAMGHLILPDDLLDNLGPAVGAGRSILMYGPPGNGKSSISNGIRDALGDKIYVPRACAAPLAAMTRVTCVANGQR